MSDNDSGEYDASKLREKGMRIPVWVVTTLITVVGAASTYGVVSGQTSQRMDELERRTREQATDSRAQAAQIASHDVKIAVISEKLDTIILQLGSMNQKLERAEQERK